MVKPVTAKRRNKVLQAQHAQQQQAVRQREEELTLHDEADVMSFRTAATHRFLMNQELMEGLLERWIPLENIIAPKPFAKIQTTKSDISEIEGELYFGNVELMRQKLALLEKEVNELNESKGLDNEDDLNDKSSFRKINFLNQQIDDLSNSFKNPESKIDIDSIKYSYSSKFNKTFKEEPHRIRTITKINNDLARAPENYWVQLKKAKEDAELEKQKRQQELLLQQQQQQMHQLHHQQQQQQQQMHNQAHQIPTHLQSIPSQALQTGQIASNDYNDGFQIPNPTAVGANDMNYDPSGFGEDMNMIDDVGFGLQASLDDQDFLSGIDDGMDRIM